MAGYEILLYSVFASIDLAGAGLIAILWRRWQDRIHTGLAVAAACAAAGYFFASVGFGSLRHDSAEIARRETLSVAFLVAFCALASLALRRFAGDWKSPLLAATIALAAVLLGLNAYLPFSLRYASIAATHWDVEIEYVVSPWRFGLALLALATVANGLVAAARLHRRGSTNLAMLLALTLFVFASGLAFDFWSGDANAPLSRLEWVGIASLAFFIVGERLTQTDALADPRSTPAYRAMPQGHSFAESSFMMAVITPEGFVTDLNKEAELRWGASRRQALGSQLWELPAFQRVPRVSDRVKESVESMSELSRTTIRTPYSFGHDTRCWLDMALKRIDGAQAILVEAQDITAQQLDNSAPCLSKLSRDDPSLLERLSHELRTPLNPLIGYAHLLLSDSSLSATQRSYVESIRKSAQELGKTIERAFDLPRIDADEFDTRRDLSEIASLLESLRNDAMAQVREHGFPMQVRTVVEPGTPELIYTDCSIVSQVLHQIANNAVKFARRGEIVIGVAADKPGHVSIYIEDSGPGIPSEEASQVFAPFFQGKAARDNNLRGLGVGLSIAQSLAELISGKLAVESRRDGSGCRVTLTLPHDPSRRNAEEAPMNVLLIEDDEINRDFLSKLLSSRGYRTIVAETGERGLEIMRRQHKLVDLVLLDLRLPGIDGLRVAQTIRSTERANGYPNTPIIAISATARDSSDRAKCIKAGCNGFLAKPVRATELFRLIEDQSGLTPSMGFRTS